VELALDHAEPHHGIVDRRQRLVEPRLVRGGLAGDVDDRAFPELVVELDRVAVVTVGGHLGLADRVRSA
jgi:hypothetical protein